MEFNFLYSVAGLVVGFIIGLTGVGGGSLMTPLLILFFKINPISAVITDLFYAAITKSTGLIVYTSKKLVTWNLVWLLLLGSIPASILTLNIINLSTLGIDMQQWILRVLGFALILTATVLFLDTLIRKFKHQHTQEIPSNQHTLIYSVTLVILGIFLGVMVTISSVGAGALGLACLSLLYPRLAMTKLVAIDLAHAVILSLVAGIGHLQYSSIDFSVLIPLLIGSIPGVLIGSNVGSLLPDKYMRPIIASLLLLLGIKFCF